MGKVAILTDSNSGITQAQSKELGVKVIPMPFFIDGEQYFEDINLTQEEFYEKLQQDADISTSQPSIGEMQDAFDELLKEYDELVYIPMSSGLSGTCQTATMVADDYDGKVQVVNNQRISVTMRQSVLDAKELAFKQRTCFHRNLFRSYKDGKRNTTQSKTIGKVCNLTFGKNP
jgi:DegV family protein with EDD domain